MADERERAPIERYTRWIVRHRRWVILASVLLAVLVGSGITRLGLSSDYRVFFSEDNPDLLAFEAMEKTYTKNDNVLFVLHPEGEDVFTPRVLDAVRSLTDDAWRIPYATRVDAITNFQHTWANDDELVVEDLVPGGGITPAIVARAREVSLAEPLLVRRIVAPDGSATGVNVRIVLPGKSQQELRDTVARVRELERRYRDAYPEIELHVSGISMMNDAFADSPRRDMSLAMPLMFGMLVLATFLFLRTGTGTVATLLVIVLSTTVALGIAGRMGLLLDPASAAAPVIILTLAIADSVHVLVSYLNALRRGRPREDALVEAMQVNVQPVFLTSLTTVIGFLSLNFSDAPPFRLLGNLTALGVVVAWVYAMTLLPAVVASLPAPRVTGGRLPLTARLSEWVARLTVRHRRNVLVVSSLVTVVLGSSISLLNINDQFFEYFARSLPFRQATEFTFDHLTGQYVASFSLDSGETQGVSDPAFLDRVEAFTDWLRGRGAVIHVRSFTDTMKRLNMNMHGDDPAYHRLPETRDLGAQYLLLYELSLPYGLDVNDEINVDKRALRVDVTYDEIDTDEIEHEVELAEAWLRENGAPSMASARGVGPALMFARITDRNVQSMLKGTAIGFGAIAIILMIALRSVRLGLISLVPNVLPAAMAFGIWALTIGEVGFAVSIVAGLSIGIIVDDTVHFLAKYRRARRDESAARAVEAAFRQVGSAILGTTLIVSTGFAMLGLSTFRVTSYMGLLTALTVVCAMAVDFLLLPTLLMALDRRRVRVRERLQKPLRSVTPLLAKGEVAMRTMLFLIFTTAVGASAVLAQPSPSAGDASIGAVDPARRGHAIAVEAFRRDSGWHDTESTLRMVLRNGNGDESRRELRRRALEDPEPGHGEKSVVIFDSPRDVKGTAFLSHTRVLEPDDQWLYLPAIERVKRISSANKSGPFVGSEFAYEDLLSQEVEKYEYRWLRDERLDGVDCFVVERIPRYENSGYTRQVVWFDAAEYRYQRIDFYDRKNDLLKTLTYAGYVQYLDRFWRPHLLEMVNHQTGKSTLLSFEDWTFEIGLGEEDFTASRLKRVR